MTTRRALREGLRETVGAACQACPVTPVGEDPPRVWEDLHEVLTRARGGSPVVVDNILCVCRPCHTWIGTHEKDARQLGLIRTRTAEEHRQALRPWEKL